MTWLPQFGPSNGCKVVQGSPTSVDPRIKYLSRRSIHLHSYDMAEPAQPLDISTLHNVYVIEELIQLNSVHASVP